MYRLSESEFFQYRTAEQRLKDIRRQHALELQEAYDNIHPTKTRIDTDLGRIYVESINPETYAIYLVELRQEHEEIERWWAERAKVYNQAYRESGGDMAKTREILAQIISTRPDLQRKQIDTAVFDELKEYDSQIDNMSMDELLEDYWDSDEENSEEQIRDRCIKLHESYDMPVNEIASLLGITTSRVRKHINRYLKTEGST